MSDVGRFMDAALAEARLSLPGDVPVGAVIVRGGEIVGRGHNVREAEHSPSGHAEIRALEAAARTLGDWRLEGCDMFVTLEPCPMCAGAILSARIRRVYFGAFDPEAGAAGSRLNLLYPQVELYPLVKGAEAEAMLKQFFEGIRGRSAREAVPEAQPGTAAGVPEAAPVPTAMAPDAAPGPTARSQFIMDTNNKQNAAPGSDASIDRNHTAAPGSDAPIDRGSADNTTKIASFTVDHRYIVPGLYISRIDGDVTTYDMRTRRPNTGDLMSNAAMHSFEHMFATYVRNSELADSIIYFGPMGCQTGFYLLVRGAGGQAPDNNAVLAAIKTTLRKIIDHRGEIFGKSEIECGNYRNLDLREAQAEAQRFLDVLNRSEVSFAYPGPCETEPAYPGSCGDSGAPDLTGAATGPTEKE